MDKKHFKCLLWKLLWALSLISLVLVWVAGANNSVLGLPDAVWLWNSLIFGILSIPIKLDCHSCDVCGIGAK